MAGPAGADEGRAHGPGLRRGRRPYGPVPGPGSAPAPSPAPVPPPPPPPIRTRTTQRRCARAVTAPISAVSQATMPTPTTRATSPYVSRPGRALAGPMTHRASPTAPRPNDSSSQVRLISGIRSRRSRSGSRASAPQAVSSVRTFRSLETPRQRKATAGIRTAAPMTRLTMPPMTLTKSTRSIACSNMTIPVPTRIQPIAASAAHIHSSPSRPGPTCIFTSSPRTTARSASIASRSGQERISTGGGGGGSGARRGMRRTLPTRCDHHRRDAITTDAPRSLPPRCGRH